MSWMDSWSRPGKHQPTPAPFYLLPNGGEDIPYCRSCGRVISSRKSSSAVATVTDYNTNHENHQKRQKKTKKGKGSRSRDDDVNAQAEEQDASQKLKREQHDQEVKYCSSRCKTNKPGKGNNSLDRRIEDAFVEFLSGAGGSGEGNEHETTLMEPTSAVDHNDSKKAVKRPGPVASVKKTAKKGDTRILVPCDVIEQHVFGEERRLRSGDDEENKTFGRKKNRASRVLQPRQSVVDDVATTQCGDDGQFHDEQELSRIMMDSSHSYSQRRRDGDHEEEAAAADSASVDPDVLARLSIRSGTRIRPPQIISEVNGSVGGEKGWAERIVETEEMKGKRIEGQRRSHEKEMVRSAARRGVVFGFVVEEQDGRRGTVQVRKKCEAVMQGKVVEPSFAKGSWGVRWREE